MRLTFAALACLCLAAHAATDGGGAAEEPPDGGALDGGARDAGADMAPAAPIATWDSIDGGLLDAETGLSDRVTLTVGASQRVTLPQHIMSGHCDDQSLLRIDGEGETLIFVGLKPGRTHCGFWFSVQPFPSRYFEVLVLAPGTLPPRPPPVPDAGPPRPFWSR